MGTCDGSNLFHHSIAGIISSQQLNSFATRQFFNGFYYLRIKWYARRDDKLIYKEDVLLGIGVTLISDHLNPYSLFWIF